MIKKVLVFGLVLFAIANLAKPRTNSLPQPNSEKLATLYGAVDEDTYRIFARQMEETSHLPGHRLIVINSPGGMVYYGQLMIDMMHKEQARGVKMICKVDGQVSSMAFNLLSHCDVRLATRKSFGVVHKIAAVGICGYDSPERCTARNLRKQAEMLDQGDEPYRQKNAEMMNLSLKEYDVLADNETFWTAAQLFRIGYLHDVL